MVGIAGGAPTAAAHIDLDFPAQRGGNQKAGPCEGLPLTGDSPVTVAEPGSIMTVRITETIGHPGHFRIMFDDDVTDGEDFPDPAYCDDVGTPDGVSLLADFLLPAQGGTCPGFHTPSERTPQSGAVYEFDVTLPDIECDNCALQVIQVMTDAGKADVNGNWDPTGGKGLYFRCANLKLSAAEDPTPDPGGDPDPDPGTGPDAGTGLDPDPGTDPDPQSDPDHQTAGGVSACSAAGGGASGGGFWLLVMAFCLAWRRRR